ncbi:hypothetical protein PMI15_02250 [Polaromonas sp. CF318]|uniref:hypothetical protein n=1 Tax=Polaromonas sp. CF318 TaxID=1144318 RepID=UPI000271356B|nr:hypothetical protein [Polaromonas sp. CF318]EJL84007.1 hypothetical protein PMI15_02250 [Polaromonas sp. CF318]
MAQRLQFPLQMSFKLMAFAPQFLVKDARDQPVAYVKQKLFKLKEAISVFTNEKQDQLLHQIKADRVIDFSALYHFTDHQGAALGGIKRRGMRSMWRAGFEVLDNGITLFSINEKSVTTRFLDGLFSQIPLIGIFSGYVFHPAYQVTRPDGTLVAELTKQPALFEGRFAAAQMAPFNEREEQQLLLALMTVLLLERMRG